MYQSERLARAIETLSILQHCTAVDMRVGFDGLKAAGDRLVELAVASDSPEIKGAVLELALGHRDAAMSCVQIGEALAAVLAELKSIEPPAAVAVAVAG